MTLPPTLILHNDQSSPFSEKIRLMLGYKNMSWKSVVIPAVRPKSDLVALTGGYRRTPVLQIGADIYCDTALIADVLEHIEPLPRLYPEPSKGMARILAQWADTTLFGTSMTYNLQPKGLAQIFGQAPPDAAKAFAEDRKVMGAGMLHQRPQDAAAAYRSYLRRLSDMLDDRPYMLGEVPCITDFAMYHPLWFTRVHTSALADLLSTTPSVIDWMDRMAAIGHGKTEKCSQAEAIEVAAASMPSALHDEVFQDEHGISLGSQVLIGAEDCGLESTQGQLVAATRMHYTLRRTDERAGLVHVHFPRIGCSLKAVVPQ